MTWYSPLVHLWIWRCIFHRISDNVVLWMKIKLLDITEMNMQLYYFGRMLSLLYRIWWKVTWCLPFVKKLSNLSWRSKNWQRGIANLNTKTRSFEHQLLRKLLPSYRGHSQHYLLSINSLLYLWADAAFAFRHLGRRAAKRCHVLFVHHYFKTSTLHCYEIT